MMIPVGPMLAAATAWLATPSTKVNKLIPESIRTGTLSVAISMATKRYVLLFVLVMLAMFGTEKELNEAALVEYVTDELGIDQNAILRNRMNSDVRF
jgi:2-hydroxychromene-2-carboxylate isomerase